MFLTWFLSFVLLLAPWLPSSCSQWAENKLSQRFNLEYRDELSEIKSFPLVEGSFNFRPQSAIVVDVNSDFVVLEKNAALRRPIASLTKMMSSLVLVQNKKLGEVITITDKTTEVEGSRAGFKAGEKFKVKELVRAMLVRSANDAAYALQEYFATEEFNLVKAMNEEAQRLGLKNTYFADAIGLSEKNTSTAWEVYLLAKELLQNKWLADVVSQSHLDVCSLDGNCYSLWNTNRLVRQGFKGIKTGYTEEAGHCLAALKYVQNHPVIIVVLGAADGHIRFEDVELAGAWLERSALY
ncbi:D-alanyl-D-alanine carboxypeptidase [bacterium]|nr:D-alanyl-D-alanine carboxypeptidase [bacterium]